MKLLNDIRTAVETFGAIRKARKAGTDGVEVKVQRTYTLPVVNTGYWGWTMEGCLFCGKQWEPVRDMFDSFDENIRRDLTFTPKNPGEWADRARFWQERLKPVLPPELYHAAMLKITHWFAHCVRMRSEAVKA